MPLTPRPLVAVGGATGVGKSGVAARVARALGGEVLCADSRQLYRGLAVGSAQPDAATRALAPHHLYEALDPAEPCSAGAYRALAAPVVAAIESRGAVPVAAGGTGFYLEALVRGGEYPPPAAAATVDRLRCRVDREGAPAVWAELDRRDPASAARIHPNDAYRIVRALAVLEDTGTPASTWREAGTRRPHVLVVLELPRPELYRRLDDRCAAMFAGGLLEEARALQARGLPPDTPVLRAIGYPHAFAHLEGKLGAADALARMRLDTRQYAKRQLTWFRNRPGARHVDATDPDRAAATIAEMLKSVQS